MYKSALAEMDNILSLSIYVLLQISHLHAVLSFFIVVRIIYLSNISVLFHREIT